MFIDHVIVCFTLLPIPILITLSNSNTSESGFVRPVWFETVFTIIASLYFLKDSIGARSPAKRLTNLQVISQRSQLPASPLQCFIRNMTIIIWPIEVLVTLFSSTKRLGDHLAGTYVAFYDPTIEQQPTKVPMVILSFILSLTYSIVLVTSMNAIWYAQNF